MNRNKLLCLLVAFIIIVSASGMAFAHPGHEGGHGPEEVTSDDVAESADFSDSSSASLSGGSSSGESSSASSSSASSESHSGSSGSSSSSGGGSSYSQSSKSYSSQNYNPQSSNQYSQSEDVPEEVTGNASDVNRTNETNSTANMTNASDDLPQDVDLSWIAILLAVLILIAAIIYLKFIR